MRGMQTEDAVEETDARGGNRMWVDVNKGAGYAKKVMVWREMWSLRNQGDDSGTECGVCKRRTRLRKRMRGYANSARGSGQNARFAKSARVGDRMRGLQTKDAVRGRDGGCANSARGSEQNAG